MSAFGIGSCSWAMRDRRHAATKKASHPCHDQSQTAQHRRTSFWITHRPQAAQVREDFKFDCAVNPAHIYPLDILSHMTSGDHEPCLLVAAYPIRHGDFLPDPERATGPDLAFLPGPCALNCSQEGRGGLPILPQDFIQWQSGQFSSSGKVCSMDAAECECSPCHKTLVSLASSFAPVEPDHKVNRSRVGASKFSS